MKFIKLYLCLLLASLNAFATTDDLSVIKERFAKDLWLDLTDEASKKIVIDSPNWANAISAEGHWSDVKYNLDDNQFSPSEHIKRMDFMSRAYTTKGTATYESAPLKAAVLKAFDYWIKVDVKSYNWWHNEIGTPQRFARTMLLMEPHLGQKRINDGLKILKRAIIQYTGQNRLWVSELVLIRGLFEKSSRTIQSAVKELQNVISISHRNAEGVQKDLSFHQHGHLIYNGGYGAKFSTDFARLVNILAGTAFSFSPAKIKILSDYILDAQIWMTRGNKWDYSVTGRELARKQKDAQLLKRACYLLSQSSVPRQNEFKKCYESLANNKHYLEGNKHFWTSDYMLQQSPNYFASVRMYSHRTMNNDAPSNGEGLLSHHLADGGMFIMRNGNEYEDIFPVWDWRLVPGTTTELKKLVPAIYEPGNWDGFAHIRYTGKSKFVGGVSDTESGISAMDFISNKRYEKVDARKSWIFTKDTITAMGNQIRCQNCSDIVTTVDQKLLKGKVYVLHRSGAIDEHTGVERYKDIIGVYHDGTGYFFKEGQEITVSAKAQKGNWRRINQQLESTSISKNVFTLTIGHLENNHKIATDYVYQIIPGIKLKQFKASSLSSKIQNTSRFMSYTEGGKIYLTAFEAGSFNVQGTNIEVNKPCLLILNMNEGSFSVSDPTQSLNQIELKINGKVYSLKLPSGDSKGASLKAAL